MDRLNANSHPQVRRDSRNLSEQAECLHALSLNEGSCAYNGKTVQTDEVLMIYRGTVRNGVVVLPPDVHLPDGQDVTVQPVREALERAEKDETDSGSGWPEGYFEQTAGALAGEDFERPPQGELPSRDEW